MIYFSGKADNDKVFNFIQFLLITLLLHIAWLKI